MIDCSLCGFASLREIRCLLIAFLIVLTASIQSRAQSSGLTTVIDRGVLSIRGSGGAALSNMRLRLRFSSNSSVSGRLEFSGKEAGNDASGNYERFRYRFQPDASFRAAPSFSATLEIQNYRGAELVVASLIYSGPPLAPRDGIQLLMGLDRFGRGMATKRMKLYWTSPAFVSDYRILGPANQLLLWQQIDRDDYHLLIPLAGDGFISEVGVSEIEYRPEFRVASSSYDPNFSPGRVPLFAYSRAKDPYRLARDSYEVAFKATNQYGRLRWQKSYPEIFESFGWCSWNAYGHEVSQEKILNSVRSLRDKQIPLGFVLVDDGWLSTKDQKLVAFSADRKKFPNDLGGLVTTLRSQFHIPHVGVWHTFQGYWSGVDPASEIGRAHRLFTGVSGNALPDPRSEKGESFYSDWYRGLKDSGIDFVKVDGQGNNVKFTDGLMPLFVSGGGQHRNFQEAARRYFSDPATTSNGLSAGLNAINCMEMSLENAYNWSISNLARNSDDYLPDNPQNVKEHIYQNAYNAYWIANFAYPDWDMFQSHDAHAEYHAVARAISGGPVYITDEPGKERPEILLPLVFSDGRLLMLDAPGQVTRDILLTDVALEAVPLKVFGNISRPGLSVAMVAAFNVNKTANEVTGAISRKDLAHLLQTANTPETLAVYQRKTGTVTLLDQRQTAVRFVLDKFGFDVFTLSPVDNGVAVFGLTDKYLGPAAIVRQSRENNQLAVRIREAGDFAAWLQRAPTRVEVDGQPLSKNLYSYSRGLLRIPRSSFAPQTGEHELRLILNQKTHKAE
jgi:raffinose synthase